jgi:hypothetical protein
MVLIVLFVVAFITGYIASWLAVSDFAPHRFSALALIVCVFAHLCLHWRRLLAPLRQLRMRTLARPRN